MRAGSLLGALMGTKPFTDIADQISILQGRGMQVEPELAATWFSNVGYYRLSGYWYVYREADGCGDPTDEFQPGTAFSDITALYEFDRKLRTLLHDAIERIEVGLRSHLSDHLGRIDPLVHEDSAHFRPGFDHTAWLSVAHRRIDRAISGPSPRASESISIWRICPRTNDRRPSEPIRWSDGSNICPSCATPAPITPECGVGRSRQLPLQRSRASLLLRRSLRGRASGSTEHVASSRSCSAPSLHTRRGT